MGGKVLELESDKLIEQGLELGRLENQMATVWTTRINVKSMS